MRIAVAIDLTSEEQVTLAKYSRGRHTPMRLVKRAQVVLLAAEGKTTLRSLRKWGWPVDRLVSGGNGLPGSVWEGLRRTLHVREIQS